MGVLSLDLPRGPRIYEEFYKVKQSLTDVQMRHVKERLNLSSKFLFLSLVCKKKERCPAELELKVDSFEFSLNSF